MEHHTVEYESGKNFLQKYNCYTSFIRLIKDTHAFMSSFSFLQFGRDTVLTKLSVILSPSSVLDSTVKTLHSILLCCEYGHFTDTIILIRKYRDDLLFYLYLISVGESCDLLNSIPPGKHEENIKKWQTNALSDLHVSEILKYIGMRPEIRPAIKKYNLRSGLEKIGVTLNNYVHGNGVMFYNQHPQSYTGKQIKSFVNSTTNHLSYITVSFVFLLALCQPSSIMSSDYVDYMDCGDIPPENSQYWVAPFVEEYLGNYGCLLGADCMGYLREITNMEIGD